MKILIPIILVTLMGCKTNHDLVKKESGGQPQESPALSATPQVLVYKTKADYNNRVSVILSDDKTQIISYPDPHDIKMRPGYPAPTPLHDGYLLDNRGIGKNVAFLSLTWTEYAGLQKIPSLKELYGLVVDKDPLRELIDCGNINAFTNPVKQLNKLIDSKSIRLNTHIIK